MGNVAINNYSAGDGRPFWIVGLEGHRHWPPLARAVGHPEWLEDERFATPAARAQNASELIALLDESFATKTLDEWAVIFDADPDFFWAPVQTVDELLGDQQFHAAGGLVEVPSEDARGRCWRHRPTSTSTAARPATAPRSSVNTRTSSWQSSESPKRRWPLSPPPGRRRRWATARRPDVGPGARC